MTLPDQLEALAIVLENSVITFGGVVQTEAGQQAAAALRDRDRLAAENAALREALKPFAECADYYDTCEQHGEDGCPDDALAGEMVDLTVGDFRKARAAIAEVMAWMETQIDAHPESYGENFGPGFWMVQEEIVSPMLAAMKREVG